MIELVAPTTRLADSWWAMVDEFGSDHVHGSGYRHEDRGPLDDPRAFAAWVALLRDREEPGRHLEPGRVPSAYRWIVEDDRVLGTIAVRWALTPALLEVGGHIGYAVAPSVRCRGVASAALRQGLDLAAGRGIDPVLITCETANTASRRTIERAGGILEDERCGQLRFWVPTGAPARPLDTDPVETGSARLVLVTPEDAAAMLRGNRRVDWAEGYPREDDLDAVRGLADLEGAADAWSSRHVVRRSDDRAVGTIGTYGPPVAGVVELGYGLIPEARGSGLMTDVLGAYCRAIEATGTRVTAHTDPGNLASHRVLARLGFECRPTEPGEEWLWTRVGARSDRTA